MITDLNPYVLTELASFVHRIEIGRRYQTSELARLGADASVLACFDGIAQCPTANVLCVVCLMLGVDVWSENQPCPKVGYLRVRALARIAELMERGAQ